MKKLYFATENTVKEHNVVFEHEDGYFVDRLVGGLLLPVFKDVDALASAGAAMQKMPVLDVSVFETFEEAKKAQLEGAEGRLAEEEKILKGLKELTEAEVGTVTDKKEGEVVAI